MRFNLSTARQYLRRMVTFLFVPLSMAVLLLCLFYAYSAVFLAPYPGILLDPNWVVSAVPSCEAPTERCLADQDVLQIGDQLLQIGSLRFEDTRLDRRRGAFDDFQPGDSVPVVLRRAGRQLNVEWQLWGPTTATLLERLGSLLIFMPFWLAGTAVLFYLRPRDLRWQLLILFNYVTAVWLATGLFSSLHTANSSLVLHAVSWLMAPIYVHLHLTIPNRFFPTRVQRLLLAPLYLATVILAALELAQLLPDRLYNAGLLLAILGSLALLALRLVARRSSAERLTARFIFLGIGVSFMPGIVFAVLPTVLHISLYNTLAPNIAILAVPFLPYFYIYAIYKHQLGSMELWANRLLSLCSFFLIYVTAMVVVYSVSSQWLGLPTTSPEFNLVVSTAFVMLALPLRGRVQQLVDRLAYGVKYARADLIRDLANRLPTALESDALVQLLIREVTPSLLIRQSALYLLDESGCQLLYADAIRAASPGVLQRLLALDGQYRPPQPDDTGEGDWVRLAIALKVREKVSGIWLLGRRDPDDFYPQQTIALLKTLGNQIATVLENIRLFDETRNAAKQLERIRQQVNEAFQTVVLEKGRYAAVIRSMGAAAVITDQDQRIVAVNSMAETVLRQSQGSLLSQPWHDLFSVGDRHGEPTASFWHLSPLPHNGERSLSVRGRFPLHANPEVVLDIISTPVQANGQLEGYVHVLQDASALEEFTRSKDQFLLNVAHELEGPLASWRASLDLLMEDYATISTRDLGVMLRTLQRTAVKFQGLVETLIDIGKMQSGRFIVRPSMGRFNQLILDSLGQIEPLLKTRGQQLELNLDSTPGCVVMADRTRMIQVVVNLLKNASKYAPEDQPVGLRAYQEGAFVFLEVTDHGPGIPPEEQSQLFKRFYRAKRVEDEGAGIGIGLALVKGIVEAHGGQVGVRSRLGEGATFWFSLPGIVRADH